MRSSVKSKVIRKYDVKQGLASAVRRKEKSEISLDKKVTKKDQREGQMEFAIVAQLSLQ